MAWRLSAPGDRLALHSWAGEDLSIVYSPMRGDTHLLGPLAFECIRLIDSGPRSTEVLVTEVEELVAADDRRDLLDSVQSVLRELQNLGLVTNDPA